MRQVRRTSVVRTKHCRVFGSQGELLPGAPGAFPGCWHDGDIRVSVPGSTKLRQLLVSSPFLDRTRSRGQEVVPSSLDYVTRGMWNSFVSKISGLLGGFGSLLALWSSLKSPVPMFMGIPMMMHSDTPHTESFCPK